MKSFFFHYNKPRSQQLNKPQISVHYKGICHIVDNIIVNVTTKGKIRTNRQPYFVVTGKASSVEIKDNVAVIS